MARPRVPAGPPPSMSDPFLLRFLTGDRSGESIPLTGPTFTVGRRPGNTLQVADPSVSGRHAELVIDDLGVSLTDLGSTNGTKVDGRRIQEERLSPGCTISFGSVDLRFEEAGVTRTAGDTPAPPHAEVVAPAESLSGEAASTVDAAMLDRARKSNRALPLAVLALALAAAGAWTLLPSGEGEQGPTGTAASSLPTRPGDLLASSASFEGGLDQWSEDGGFPEVFEVARAAARSGRSGLRAILEAGTLEQRSNPLPVQEGALTVHASLRSDAGRGRVSVELSSEARTLVVEGPWNGGGDWEEQVWSCSVPPGFTRARVVLTAATEASVAAATEPVVVDFDDVSLVPAGRGEPLHEIGVKSYLGSGTPLTAVHLVEVQTLLLPSVTHTSGATVHLNGSERGALLTVSDAGEWVVRVAAEVVSEGLRSMTARGSSSHPTAFERDDAEVLLVGAGARLLALRGDGGQRVSGAPLAGGDWELRIAGRSLEVQVAFEDELAETLRLASSARNATRGERPGEALRTWQQLLDESPFDSASIQEAEAAIAALVLSARSEVAGLERTFERARFFRLADAYRAALAEADALAQRFAGTELAEQVEALMEPAREELASLQRELDADEVLRLEAIHRALMAQGGGQLANAVQTLLAERQGGGR